MRPLTHTLPKAMLSVAGKPTIFHIIDRAEKAGVKDFVIITGYLRELMESEILAAYPHLKIEFVEQKEQLGLGHAIYTAREKFQDTDSMLLIYGDTLFEGDIEKMMSSKDPVIGVFEVDDPRRFGVIEKGPGQTITRLVEKPEVFVSNLAIPGVNFFPSAKDLFAALDHIVSKNIRTKNEYQATDAFEFMLSEKKITFTWLALTAWDDAGTLDAILETNKIILARRGKGQTFSVAKSAKVNQSHVEEFVSISDGAEILDSTLINCIVDRNAKVHNAHLKNSIIGRGAHVENVNGTLIVGDDTVIIGDSAHAAAKN